MFYPRLNRFLLYWTAALLSTATLPAFAAPDTVPNDEYNRNLQRQQELQERIQPTPEVRPEQTPTDTAGTIPVPDDQPCFPIEHIQLSGESAAQFQFGLSQAIARSAYTPGMCLGAQSINQLMRHAQNAIIERGYTTTRILAAPQDLNNGTLTLTLIPGRIHTIRVERDNLAQTHADRILWQNAFPARPGDILNLRDLEQGLENLKRVPTAEADIRIEPAAEPNESDVVITWKQRTIPYRITLSADDSGSKATGKYQGSVTLSADNPLGLSDLFYFSYNRHLGHAQQAVDPFGRTQRGGTEGYAGHYSVPIGYWLLSANVNQYRYHQAVAGLSENYDYNGQSRSADFTLSRSLYRDARRKTSLALKLWRRESWNYINDAEVDGQHQRMAGWQAILQHKEYLGAATLDARLSYKRGTGANDSIRPPQEELGQGTSRMQVITADLDLNLPFALGNQHFAYDSGLHAQWNLTPLVQQDKLAIGGRYTVRGFDGEMSLAAERGWYWRNDLSWQYLPGHQVYLGVDVGHVAGASAKDLLGQTLAGGALGLKGQFKLGGALSYDLFVGKPFKKPARFPTDNTTYGFSVNYSF